MNREETTRPRLTREKIRRLAQAASPTIANVMAVVSLIVVPLVVGWLAGVRASLRRVVRRTRALRRRR